MLKLLEIDLCNLRMACVQRLENWKTAVCLWLGCGEKGSVVFVDFNLCNLCSLALLKSSSKDLS